MQFQVPQFIEVEDKIFGPLTFKQFVFIMGGLGLSYLLWRLLPLLLAAPLIAATAGFAASLAFLQFNGRPFLVALENAFYYFVRSKLYLWNNEGKQRVAKAKAMTPVSKSPEVYIPKLSDSRLHELAWSLDIKERIAAGVAEEGENASRFGPIITPRTALPGAQQHALAS